MQPKSNKRKRKRTKKKSVRSSCEADASLSLQESLQDLDGLLNAKKSQAKTNKLDVGLAKQSPDFDDLEANLSLNDSARPLFD